MVLCGFINDFGVLGHGVYNELRDEHEHLGMYSGTHGTGVSGKEEAKWVGQNLF